jgi:hypothetical protein
MAMAERDLKKEIELMLSLVPGDWRLVFDRPMERIFVRYYVTSPERGIMLVGDGLDRASALRDLLETWRSGKTSMPPAPAMSKEELRLKLAVYGKDRKKCVR